MTETVEWDRAASAAIWAELESSRNEAAKWMQLHYEIERALRRVVDVATMDADIYGGSEAMNDAIEYAKKVLGP